MYDNIVDGGWEIWEQWSDCSVSCEGGIQHRHRKCTKPSPQYDGKTCPENSGESRPCEDQCCPSNKKLHTDHSNVIHMFLNKYSYVYEFGHSWRTFYTLWNRIFPKVYNLINSSQVYNLIIFFIASNYSGTSTSLIRIEVFMDNSIWELVFERSRKCV